MSIIGRKREIAELNSLYNSGKAEFVAIYGLEYGEYSGVFQNSLTIDDLFKDI